MNYKTIVFAFFLFSLTSNGYALSIEEGNTAGIPRFVSNYPVTQAGSNFIAWGGNQPIGSGAFRLNKRVFYDAQESAWNTLNVEEGYQPPNIRGVTQFTRAKLFFWTIHYNNLQTYAGIYDRDSRSWSPIPDAVDFPVDFYYSQEPAHTVVDSKIFVWGFSKTDKNRSAGFLYDVQHQSWREIPEPSFLEPRVRPFVKAFGKKVFIWGGSNSDILNPKRYRNGAIFDVETNRWEAMPEVDPNTLLYGSRDFSTETHWVIYTKRWLNGPGYVTNGASFDLTEKTWSSLENFPNFISMVNRFDREKILSLNEKNYILAEERNSDLVSLHEYHLEADQVRRIQADRELSKYMIISPSRIVMPLPLFSVAGDRILVAGDTNLEQDQQKVFLIKP